MNWGFAAGIALIVLLLLVRSRLLNWIIEQWAAGRMSDRRAKALLLLVTLGPILIAGLWIVGVSPFPWSVVIVIVLVIVVSLVPLIGLGNQIFDERTHAKIRGRTGAEDGR